MYNILKKQNKNILILSFALCLFLLSQTNVYSQRTQKRSSTSRSSSSRISSVSTEAIATIQTPQTTEVKDTSHITKYNCEKLYMGCMNTTCFNNQNGKCSCAPSNTGNKFDEANKNCEYIVDACVSKKNEIIESYQRMAQSDCTSYVMQDIKEANEISYATTALAKLIECMKPKCVSNRTNQFLGCFDKDNMEKKLKMCENRIEGTNDPEEVKQMFNESMLTYKQKYCDEIMGTLKSDGECYLQIGFGKSHKSISKIKEFKVGDTVICSETSFGVDLGERKRDKMIAIKNIALAGVQLTKIGVDIASSILKTKGEEMGEATTTTIDTDTGTQTIDIYKGTGEIIGGPDAADITVMTVQGLAGAADIAANSGAIEGAMLLQQEKDGLIDFSYKGYCFVIKGEQRKELFEASDEYYYKLRWAPTWSDTFYMQGDNF